MAVHVFGLMSGLLYDVHPLDPGICAALAVYVPARRAASINRMSALRHE